jgi:flagellar biosynthetic protein FliR
MLESFLTELSFQYFFVFSRIGAALMLLPGFGEFYVQPRVRLLLALAVSMLVLPIVQPLIPEAPGDIMQAFVLVGGEVLAGIFIGALARIIQSVMHIAGMIIAFQSSLASAILFDSTQGSQGSVIGNFMTILGITLLFTTDLHHVMLQGLVSSYHVFIPAQLPPMGDFAESAANLLAEGFLLAVKIGAPLIVIGLLIYLGAGMMSRLMPNMQVFFIMVPLQLLISFYIMMITLSAGMMWYINHFEDSLSSLLGLN